MSWPSVNPLSAWFPRATGISSVTPATPLTAKLRLLRLCIPMLGVLVGVAPSQAQTPDVVRWVSPNLRSRAQLGIQGKLSFRQDGRSTTTIVFVEGTRAGTPARMAGLMRGDSIVGINGQRLTLERWADFRSSLQPGEEVRLTLLREGEQREVLLEAAAADGFFESAERPRSETTWNVEIPEDIQVTVESIQGRVLQAFATARARYEAQPRIALTLLQSDSTMKATLELMQEARNGFSYSFSTGAGGVVRSNSDKNLFRVMPVAPLPVEFMIMTGEAADSLTGEYVILRSKLALVQQEQRMRELELVAEARLRNQEIQEEDGILTSLDGQTQRLFSRLQNLEGEFRAVHEAEVTTSSNVSSGARVHVVTEEPAGGTSRVTVRTRPGQPTEVRVAPRSESMMNARLVGQHFVMGAQLMALSPQLSEYFAADEGVLVVVVLEGTPAAEAGIIPGDVIVRAGRYPVREVDDVRRALGDGRSGLRFRVIRKGDTLTVRLGR
jgi:PDZ domain-containing protein